MRTARGDAQVGFASVRDGEQPLLQTAAVVLQRDVQHTALSGVQPQEGLALGDLHTQVENHPAFADLRRACQHSQSLCQQTLDQKLLLFELLLHQVAAADDVQRLKGLSLVIIGDAEVLARARIRELLTAVGGALNSAVKGAVDFFKYRSIHLFPFRCRRQDGSDTIVETKVPLSMTPQKEKLHTFMQLQRKIFFVR